MKRVLSMLALCAAPGVVCAQPDGPVLHYTFDDDPPGQCADASGYGLNAEGGGKRVASPSGQAMAMDGTGATVAHLTMPEELAPGKGSWTFAAWYRPERLSIEDRQNQRRIFSFGAFPDANMVIDITGEGAVTAYLCYRDAAGNVVSGGGGSALTFSEGEWAHMAVVCDRDERTISVYINGYRSGQTPLPDGFDGDYSEHREVTIGSGWHNIQGDVDEVLLYRRALTKQEVREEFRRCADAFGATESPLSLQAERREAAEEALGGISAAWDAGDRALVRTLCERVYSEPELPAYARSYADLIAAEAYVADDMLGEARAAFERIAGEASYPGVHRMEARERAAEVARQAEGLPPRDIEATRTHIDEVTDFAADVFVAPGGDDAADGAAARPVASLTRARDLVRQHKAATPGAIVVHVAAGEYHVRETLALTAEDGGAPGAPVVYRAEGGKATFYGGQRLTGFAPVTDQAVLARLPEEARGKVYACDLAALGVTDYGERRDRGFGLPPSPPTLELYVDGRPMTPARWPNEGFVKIGELVDPGAGHPAVFTYLDDRHARWAQADDVWLFGYFHWLWADAAIKVGKIDPVARTVTTAEAYPYGGGMDNGQGIQYYALNLLEEIDTPGEWYLDRKAGKLYLYPPTDPNAATIEIGMFSAPMVTMRGVSHVQLEGLTFDLGRYQGLVLEDSSDCLIAGCTVSRMADSGVLVHGGERVTLLGCDIRLMGRRGTEVIGGDRATLTPGGHVVENCVIASVGRIDRTYTPCIQLEGVGNRVAHNLMFDCPSSAMRIEGNDHQIEYNRFHSVVRESDDQGAIDIFANPSYRGVIYRYNIFDHIGNVAGKAGVHGQAGIRLDDAISGQVIYGNVFFRSANGNFGGVQMNSGRDNWIDNNAFVDCKQGVSGGYYPGNSVWNALRETGAYPGVFLTDLYLERYPEMARMLEEPGRNFLWGNLFYRCGRVATSPDGLDMFENHEPAGDPGFVDPEAGDFHLDAGAEIAHTLGFRPIPVDEIGLYESLQRASWPVPAEPIANAE
jgi:hypothetical protein